MNKKVAFWLEGLALDLRSLALFRMAFGICLFIDVLFRMFYINDFYTDQSVLPREAIIGQFLGQWETSLLFISGQPEIIFTIFLATLVAIVMFTIGYRTRLAAFLLWILINSIYSRAQIVLHGGDDLIRVLLFWCQFVPLAAVFSVDRYLSGQEPPQNKTLLSLGGAGLLFQLLFLYMFTAALKFHPVWTKEGSAVYYALSLEQFTDKPGQWLLQFPQLMKFLTFSTLVLELFGPFLLLVPMIQRYVRIPIVLAFISFHFGLFVTLHLGPFPWTCMAAWLFVLPAGFWDLVQKWPYRPIFHISEFIKKQKWIAEVPPLKFSSLFEWVAGVFVVLMLLWNLSHHDWFPYKKSENFRIVMVLTHLHQKWNMFAPYPRKDDGWYIVEAKLFNGETVNPFAHDLVYTEEKPRDVAATYKNTMWRKYLSNSWLKTNHKYRVYFGRYLCRNWNSTKTNHDDKINTIKISFMLQMTPPPGKEAEPTKKELLWRHYCFNKPENWDKE